MSYLKVGVDGIPGKESAIFLHGSQGIPADGCIAVPEEDMETAVTSLHADCLIVIDNP